VQLPAMRRLVLDERQIPAGHERSESAAQDFQLGALDFDDGFDALAEDAAFAVSDGDARLGLAFLGGYRFAQVYAPPQRQFICFEPMTAPANALRSGDGLTVLEPGQSASARFAVDVETSAPG
jgi:aldose 1-epimerase